MRSNALSNLDIIKALIAIAPGYWTELHTIRGTWVSDTGLVASSRGKRVKLLKGGLRGKYRSISSIVRGPYLHQVMCEVFHGPRPAGCEVRHLDGNPLNNRSDNLAWGTRSENHRDKIRHGTDPSGERNPMARLTRRSVLAMRQAREEEGLSYRRLGERFGVSTMTAYRAVVGISWQ